MSVWNVFLKTRQEIIEVKKILQKWEEFAADFPGMEILDQKGRKHTIAYLDMHCSRSDWDRIAEGTKIILTFKEIIVNPTIIFPAPAKTLKVLSPGAYTWLCNVCGKRGEVDSTGVEDPKILLNKIYAAHIRARNKILPTNPGCTNRNVRILDPGMVEQGEVQKIVALATES